MEGNVRVKVNGMVTLLLLCMIRGMVFIIRLIVMVTLLYSLLTVTIMVCTIISYSLHTCIIRVIIKYGVPPVTVGIRIGKLFVVVNLFVEYKGFPGRGGFAHL